MPPCSSPVLRHGQCQQLHLPSSLHAISQTRSQRVSPRHRNKTRLAWRSVSPSASRESSVHATSEPHDDRFSAQGEIKVQSRRQLLAQVTAAVAVVSGLTVPPALPSTHAAELPTAGEPFCYVLGNATSGVAPGAGSAEAAVPAGARTFASVGEAATACPSGGVVRVLAGRYRERLVLDRAVRIEAWPRGAAVEVVWETQEPYQSTVEISAPFPPSGSPDSTAGPPEQRGSVVLQGLTIRHASKSVANNYGVFIRAGAPQLVDCDISSATGAGVGVEGASPQLLGCRIHDCARQGLSIFGASAALGLEYDLDPLLLYGMTGGTVQGCDVYSNALDGVLVRDGASPDLLDNLIHDNGGAGVNLQDCSGRYERNTVYGNAKGAVAVSSLFELDPGTLAAGNSLRGGLRRL